MKRSLIILTALLLAIPAFAQYEESPASHFLAGVTHDRDGFGVTVGGAVGLGGGFYAASYMGKTNAGGTAIETDVVYLFTSGGFFVGPMLGPIDVEYLDETNDGAPPIFYFVHSSGLTAGYSGDKIGIWFAAKYKAEYEESITFFDKWHVGAGVTLGL